MNDNLETQYKYLRWLKESKSKKEGTIKKMEGTFKKWNSISKNKSFKTPLKEGDILKFKEKLRESTYRGNDISPGTVYMDLTNMKNFYLWLSERPGYKRIVKPDVLEYFNPSQDEKNFRYCHESVLYPSKQQVYQLCRSVNIKSVVDSRNQAIIAFLYIAGIRIDSLASLKMSSYKPRENYIDLNPKKGVRTKFSKHFKTYLFCFAPELTKVFTDWYQLLLDSSYGPNDPLFPKAKIEIDGCSFIESTELIKEHMSASRIRAIIKSQCHKAGLPHYNPHSFRHSCIAEAMELAEDAQDIKAISQNVGHESIYYVMTIYGKLPDKLLSRIIKDLVDKQDVKQK